MYSTLMKWLEHQHQDGCKNPYAEQVITYRFAERWLSDMKLTQPYVIEFLDDITIFDRVFKQGDKINVILVEKSSDRLIFITGTQLYGNDSRYCNVFEMKPDMAFTLHEYVLPVDDEEEDES